MPLSVRTVHGKKFRRAGMEFAPTPIVVDDETLAKVHIQGGKRSPEVTVRAALQADAMLVCTDVPVVTEAPAESTPPTPPVDPPAAPTNGRKK